MVLFQYLPFSITIKGLLQYKVNGAATVMLVVASERRRTRPQAKFLLRGGGGDVTQGVLVII